MSLLSSFDEHANLTFATRHEQGYSNQQQAQMARQLVLEK
jgi:exopolysaccharide biosynthesis predicted pyruvyltransferase EpsI